MRKSLNLVSAVMLYALVTVGCQKDNQPVLPVPSTERSLAGTKWRLAAFVDVKNNIKRSPDLDAPEMFTLFFDTTIRSGMWCNMTGHSIYGTSSGNQQEGLYIVDYDTGILTTCIGSTKAGEFSEDGDLYNNILKFGHIFLFELYANELRLYYDYPANNMSFENYLLFKRRQE